MITGQISLKFMDERQFKARLEDRARVVKKGKAEYYEKKMHELVRNLRDATPRFTGAASGDPTDIVVPKWHPAYGKIIGNEPGDTGWQLRVATRGSQVVFQVINPMWNLYLKYVEYGTVGISARHFTSDTWYAFKSRNKI